MIDIKATLTKIMAALHKDAVTTVYRSPNLSIGASTSTYYDFSITVPNGYKYGISVISDTGCKFVFTRSLTFNGSGNVRVYYDNVSASAQTAGLVLTVLYVPIRRGGVKGLLLHLKELYNTFFERRCLYGRCQEAICNAVENSKSTKRICHKFHQNRHYIFPESREDSMVLEPARLDEFTLWNLHIRCEDSRRFQAIWDFLDRIRERSESRDWNRNLPRWRHQSLYVFWKCYNISYKREILGCVDDGINIIPLRGVMA